MPCAPPVTIALRPPRSILLVIAASLPKLANVASAGERRKRSGAIAGATLPEARYSCTYSDAGHATVAPSSQGLRAQAPSPSFTEGTHDFVVLGFRTAAFR